MSEFKVTIETIGEVKPHPGADRLDVVSLANMAFQFVTQKGLHAPGNKVLYLPVDSVVPVDLQKEMRVEGYLSGKEKNRIKTIKLRGEISQGMVLPFDEAEKFLAVHRNVGTIDPDSLTEMLGITKYEPPVSGGTSGSGKSRRLPELLPVFDIESVQRNIRVAELLLDDASPEVEITEKLEGTNFSVLKVAGHDEFKVCSRNLEWEREYKTITRVSVPYLREDGTVDTVICNNDEFQAIVAKESGIEGDDGVRLREVFEKNTTKSLSEAIAIGMKMFCHKKPLPNLYLDTFESKPEIKLHLQALEDFFGPVHSVAVRMELIGPNIQKNIYGLKQHEVYLFASMVDGEYLSPEEVDEFLLWAKENNIDALQNAPLLFRGKLSDFTTDVVDLIEKSDGQSALSQKSMREGIVILPVSKMERDRKIGRVILKIRGPKYLEKSEL